MNDRSKAGDSFQAGGFKVSQTHRDVCAKAEAECRHAGVVNPRNVFQRF
jgi:hypothetical protein